MLTLFVSGITRVAAQNDQYVPGNKDMEKLLDKAFKSGADASGVYHIDNKKNKIVSQKKAKDFILSKGYVAIRTSEKIVSNFGVTVQVIDKIDFIDKNNFKQYAYNILRGNSGVSFSQLKNTGLFFAKKLKSTDHGWAGIHTFWAGELRSLYGVMWSGPVVNGLIDGKGVGLVRIGDRWGCFEGRFMAGFPIDTVFVRELSTFMEQSNEVLLPFEYIDIVNIRKNASGDLLKGVKEYAIAAYSDRKRGILTEYNRALTLNKRNGEYKYFSDEKELIKQNRYDFNIFKKLYDGLGVDSDNCLLKADEILELYGVLDVLNFDTRKKYVSESLIWGTYFKEKDAYADTALVWQTIRLVEKKVQPSCKSSFREFYSIISYPTLYRIKDAIYDNINAEIHRYNTMDKRPDMFHNSSNASSSISSSSNTDDNNSSNTDDNNSSNVPNRETILKMVAEESDWNYSMIDLLETGYMERTVKFSDGVKSKILYDKDEDVYAVERGWQIKDYKSYDDAVVSSYLWWKYNMKD